MVTTDLGVVRHGFHQPFGSNNDVLPWNEWAVKPFVWGRKEAAANLLNLRGPVHACMRKGLVSHRFYVQLDMEDMRMLVIPLAFHKALKVFLKSRPLPTPLALSAS